ncbi:uncharacterized protein LOC110377150 isoform X2 [Helicoverpa armigera]|uniref:uncharacterized protein LOC110377150 isoform X2 n=1 Tax=Helicoverpa armigera TaxID=29058 RepID=UPI0030835176
MCNVSQASLRIYTYIYKFSVCQRRIVKGTRTHAQKRYMVYLVKARSSTETNDNFLCGGTLVTTSQILTSAACIIRLDNLYAIAGYRKYVNGMDLENDNCTKHKKERIVKIRVPRGHLSHLREYANTSRWMALDIGVATVEKPYDFQDVTFKIYCSYIPAAIQINYDTNLDKKIGTNVVALGWGRDRGSRIRDLVDRNSETLKEVSIVIQKKDDCIKKFRGNGLAVLIEKFMLCTHGTGILDGEGNVINELDKAIYNACADGQRPGHDQCKDFDDKVYANRRIRRPSVKQNETGDINHLDRKINGSNVKHVFSRRQGICQNDHGGPLVTWVGTTELVIGVAVNGLYDVEYNCVGPYIFVSTSAAGLILKCLLSDNVATGKSCTHETTGGFDIFENVTRGYGDEALLRAQELTSDYDYSSVPQVVTL